MAQQRGGRAAFLGPDAYQGRELDTERRVNEDLHRQVNTGTRIAGGRTLSPTAGYAIIDQSGDVTLPKTGEFPIHVKNATGATLTVNVSSGWTIYADASSYTSAILFDGDSLTFVPQRKEWHVQ